MPPIVYALLRHSAALYVVQSLDCGKLRFPTVRFSGLFCSWNILSDFCRLQIQWASWRLSRALGWPPLLMGIIWSTVADIGSPAGNVLSTGLPHIPHVSCVFRMTLRFFWYACLCAPYLSCLSVMIRTPFRKQKADRLAIRLLPVLPVPVSPFCLRRSDETSSLNISFQISYCWIN